jgi:hypothetical protein
MIKNTFKIGKWFGGGKKKEESKERAKRADDLHIEIC